MSFDWGIALAGLFTGVIVGMTGMGGGALMTPILVLGFGIQPLAAVSSDLVAAVVMKPIGGGVHFRRGTVHMGLVRWLTLGSVPGALIGSYAVSRLGSGAASTIKTLLGIALLAAAVAMIARWLLGARRIGGVEGEAAEKVPVRRVPTLLVGLFGGAIVGMTSVGSGSLMIVALMLLYPVLSARELVGTDLVQAIPLVAAAAAGHLLWGEFQFGVTGALIVGSIPGVLIGSHISAKAPDWFVRPLLAGVLTLSALKLLGASNLVLVIVLMVMPGVAVVRWLFARNAAVPAAASTVALDPTGDAP